MSAFHVSVIKTRRHLFAECLGPNENCPSATRLSTGAPWRLVDLDRVAQVRRGQGIRHHDVKCVRWVYCTAKCADHFSVNFHDCWRKGIPALRPLVCVGGVAWWGYVSFCPFFKESRNPEKKKREKKKHNNKRDPRSDSAPLLFASIFTAE